MKYPELEIRHQMEEFVKELYPKAVFDDFWQTKFGTELQFRVCEETDQTFACVIRGGKFVIDYDF